MGVPFGQAEDFGSGEGSSVDADVVDGAGQRGIVVVEFSTDEDRARGAEGHFMADKAAAIETAVEVDAHVVAVVDACDVMPAARFQESLSAQGQRVDAEEDLPFRCQE